MIGLRAIQHVVAMAKPGRGTWIFEGAEFLAVRVEVNPRAMRHHLPRGLRLAGPRPEATLFVAHYPKTTFGSVYSEAGLFVHVRDLWGRANHCPWMLVDDDVALVLGREVLGYPKKMGQILFETDGDRARAEVVRRGELVFRFEARIGAPTHAAPPMLGVRTRNVHGALGLGSQRLISFTPKEQIREAREAELRFELGRTSELGDLGLGRSLSAYAYRVDIGSSLVPPLRGRGVSSLFPLAQAQLRIF